MERQKSILKGKVGSGIVAGIMAFSWSDAVAQNNAPYFTNPTPANNTTINAQVGDTVSFQVRGKDNTMQMVTLGSSALPAGATMTPALPTSAVMINNGSKVNSMFMWIPTVADVGLHTLVYTLTDNGSSPLTATRTVNILVAPQPCTLNVQALAQNVTCNGANNGTIITTVSGPFTAPLTYTWSNNATSQNLGNLAPGTYTVSVMDANGCTGSASAIVSQPAQISVSGTASNISCAASNGMININAAGGTAPYTYSWNNTATTQNLTGLQPGTYTVTVTDANQCTATASFTVGQPTASTISLSGTTSNFSCNNTSNGMVDLSVSGGTAPYTYLWSNSATTQDLMGVQSGTYTVTVTDANMCTTASSFTVGQAVPTNLAVTGTASNFSCNNALNTGAIDINVTGGATPYTYSWNNNATTEDLSGLAQGTYTVTVTDASMCTATASFTINAPLPGSITNNIMVNPMVSVPGHQPSTIYLGYGPQTLSIVSNPVGGSGFTYNWTTTTSNTSLGTMGTLAVSPATTTSYIVTVMNSVGCIDIDTVTVNVIDVRCGNNNGKVQICHKANGKNKGALCIDSASVAAHLAHGDMLGNCPANMPVFGNNPSSKLGAETDIQGDLIAYPNPTSGMINLKLPAFEDDAEVVVTDVSGKLIKTLAVGAGQTSELKIDLHRNAKGLYFVELVTKQQSYRTKVLLK